MISVSIPASNRGEKKSQIVKLLRLSACGSRERTILEPTKKRNPEENNFEGFFPPFWEMVIELVLEKFYRCNRYSQPYCLGCNYLHLSI